jgi:hypothetical protein
VNDRVTEVIKSYRELIWKYRRREYPHPNVRDANDRQVAQAYLRWCDGHEADALAFLRKSFDYLNDKFKRSPRFNRGLHSEKQMAVWKNGMEWRTLSTEASEVAARTQDATFSQTIRDLTFLLPGHEQFRRRHLLNGQSSVCMTQPQYSGGYHPKSRFCTGCPHAIECSGESNGRWNFNVTALREGRLDLVPSAVAKAAQEISGKG